MTPRVSAVVPTYNGRERLLETVPALLREPELHELIVVVDGSQDGSIELLEEMAAEDDRLRPLLVENGGDNRARQVGIEHATGDVVLFLDDDVVAHPGLVAGHARHHAARDRLVVIGYMPVATPIGPAPEDVGVRLYSQYYETQCREYERRPDRILHNLWNGNVSVPRAECLALGISNPAYDTRYGPDRELGLRFKRAGLVGAFDRSLRAEHRYVRAPERFLADAESAGEGMWLCHSLYPDELGPLTAQHFEAGMSIKTRWVVRAARRHGLYRPIERLLDQAIRVTARARRWHAQEQFVSLLVKIRSQRAALARSRRPVG